jgi:hypothetical protein
VAQFGERKAEESPCAGIRFAVGSYIVRFGPGIVALLIRAQQMSPAAVGLSAVGSRPDSVVGRNPGAGTQCVGRNKRSADPAKRR